MLNDEEIKYQLTNEKGFGVLEFGKVCVFFQKF